MRSFLSACYKFKSKLKTNFKRPQNNYNHSIMKLSTNTLNNNFFKSLPKSVRIVEVGARDGLQNEKQIIPLETKINLINLLSNTGLKYIEVGAFVSPKWIPQMANSEDVYLKINKKKDIIYSCLVPNIKGMERALEVKCNEIAIFAAASEGFSQKNINCSIDESIERFRPVMKIAKENNIKVRGYVSCVLGCPYDGFIEPKQVAKVSKTLYDLGCYEISLGDTIGIGNPLSTIKMLQEVINVIPTNCLAVHFHDTYGQALANILASLQMGINIIDSSVSGLGGCPYAKSATGNVATEDVVYMLNGLGIHTGVSLNELMKASNYISQQLNRNIGSKVTIAMNGKNSSKL